jgi:drug/metabolite transporter (DMT)-like permease
MDSPISSRSTAAAVGPRWQPAAVALAPGLFVLLWSTGFIGAKFGLPHAEPFTFLTLRFALTAVLLVVVAFLFGAPWPATRQQWARIAIAGILIQGVYLGGVFFAIAQGLPAGITALIVSLQPLVTAAAAGPVLKEKVTGRQWFGLALGLVGVVLILFDKVSLSDAQVAGIVAAVVGLVGITAGTLYQKRYGEAMDLRSGTAIQFAASAALLGAAAALFENFRIEWAAPLIFATAWLVLVLSFGAITLLYILIRRGAAAKVASLFYLVPPVTALLAYAFFGETLEALALVGMVVTLIGVALVQKR